MTKVSSKLAASVSKARKQPTAPAPEKHAVSEVDAGDIPVVCEETSAAPSSRVDRASKMHPARIWPD